MTKLTIDQALRKGIQAHKDGQVQEADRLYTAILKTQPEHPDANHNMGVLAVGVGNLEQALTFFKIAVDKNPKSEQFWLSYIDALIKLENIKDANVALKRAKNMGFRSTNFHQVERRLNMPTEEISSQEGLYKNRPNILDKVTLSQALRRADKKLQSGAWTEATLIYQDILTKFPKNKSAIRSLNTIAQQDKINVLKKQDLTNEKIEYLTRLYYNNQFPEIIDHGSKYLEEYQKSTFLYNIIGASHKALGNNTDAIEAYNEAISLDPNFIAAHFNKAIALSSQGKSLDAINAYEKVLALEPEHIDALNNMGLEFKLQGKLDIAIKTYERALEIEPGYISAHNNMGVALTEQGNFTTAIESFNKILAITTDDYVCYKNLGDVFANQGDIENAVEAYQKAVAINPDFYEAYSSLGISLAEKGLHTQAIDMLNQALAIKKDFSDGYNNLAVILAKTGQLEEAIRAYNEAVYFSPYLFPAWANCAEVLEKWNKIERLEEWVKKAVEVFTVVPDDILFYKAKLLWRQKNVKEALLILNDINIHSLQENRKIDYLNLKAKVYEKCKNYSAAYDTFSEMNLFAKNSKDFKQINSDNFLTVSRDNLLKLKSSSDQSKSKIVAQPNADPIFIVGFPRSGTTLLDTVLSSHSKIEVIEEQPILQAVQNLVHNSGYNDIIQKPLPPQVVLKARKSYELELKKYGENVYSDSILINKLPLNLLQAPFIRQLYPNAKFILALRHPMDAVLSCWQQNFEINDAMGIMVELNQIVDLYLIAMETFKICNENGNFKVLEVRYEDLICNFENETMRLLEFMDLKWEPEMENYREKAMQGRRIDTPSYSQVVQPIYKTSLNKWKNYERYLGKELIKLQPWIKEFGYEL